MEKGLAELLNAMRDGIAFYTPLHNDRGDIIDFRCIGLNSAFAQVTGLDAAMVLGKTMREVWPSVDAEWMDFCKAVTITGRTLAFESSFTAPNKHIDVRAFRWSKETIGCVFAEPPDQPRAGEPDPLAELRSLRTLTRRTIHDLNNALMRILCLTELAEDDFSPDDPRLDAWAEVHQATIKAKELLIVLHRTAKPEWTGVAADEKEG